MCISIIFRSVQLQCTNILLDDKLSYEHHLNFVLNKVNKTIGLLRIQQIVPKQSLICKSFIRPHLDYGDIVYDRAFYESFHKNLESIQYNAAIAITGSIRSTSYEKIFQKLGLESLKLRRCIPNVLLQSGY